MIEPDPGHDVSVVAADERSTDDSPGVTVDVDRWRALAEAVLRSEGASGELTLTFIDTSEIAELNEEYMDKVGPTDVLSFPMDDDPTPGVPMLLGDVVISPAVAAAQFADHAGTLDDELALLVVHGVLHVLGFDHADREDAVLMRACELDHLTAWFWAGPAPAGFRQTHD